MITGSIHNQADDYPEVHLVGNDPITGAYSKVVYLEILMETNLLVYNKNTRMLMEMGYRSFLNFCFSCPRHRKALCWSTATPACPGHRLWSSAT